MGNAPLSSAPQPTEHRVVIPVTTQRRSFGTQLTVLPPLGSSGNDIESSLPPQLEGILSTQEYLEKLGLLREQILSQWKGGWATVATVIVCICILIGFIGAYMSPGFWTSAFFDHPGYIVALAVSILAFSSFMVGFIRRESQRLVEHTEDLYRPWLSRRRYGGVQVTMKRVASLGRAAGTTTTTTSSHGGRYRQELDKPGYYTNCFVIIMNVVNEQNQVEEGGDTVSVGTIRTDDSRELSRVE